MAPTTDPVERGHQTYGWLILTVGILAASSASVLIRLAQAPPLAIGAWRLVLAGALLAPFASQASVQGWRDLPCGDRWLLVASGLALAAHFAAWITSLSYTTVASSVILVSSSPIILAVASHWLLDERISGVTVAAIALAVVGSAVVGYGDLALAGRALWGNLLALIGAVAVSVYMLIGRRLRQRLSTWAYVWPCYSIAGVALVAVCLVSRQPLFGYSRQTYLWLAALALLPQIVGHSSFNWAMRHVAPVLVAVAMLGEPIGATLLAWAVLGERPGALAIVGGLLILAGMAVASPHITKSLRGSAPRSVPTP